MLAFCSCALVWVVGFEPTQHIGSGFTDRQTLSNSLAPTKGAKAKGPLGIFRAGLLLISLKTLGELASRHGIDARKSPARNIIPADELLHAVEGLAHGLCVLQVWLEVKESDNECQLCVVGVSQMKKPGSPRDGGKK